MASRRHHQRDNAVAPWLCNTNAVLMQNRIRWSKLLMLMQVWFDNVPHTRLVEDKGGQNWISRKEDKFIFPGGGTQFIHGANKYLDQISEVG